MICLNRLPRESQAIMKACVQQEFLAGARAIYAIAASRARGQGDQEDGGREVSQSLASLAVSSAGGTSGIDRGMQ